MARVAYTESEPGKADWQDRKVRSWRNPGFEQTDSHPVVCVNWDDAKAYAAWAFEAHRPHLSPAD